MSFDCPILLIAWKRPHCIKQVIEAVRVVKPTRIYVACDGPDPARIDESKKVMATRALIDREIDWECQLRLNYSDQNLGCKEGVSKAISWFFENEEAGIILEDDCVPHVDFFEFCRTLLDRYRNDTRVWCIGGTNFQDGRWRGDGSYYFSRYNHCWGWASWRRCWTHYDKEMNALPNILETRFLESIFEKRIERRYWQRIWQQLYRHGKPNTWDYQWTFTCLINSGLTALPNKNLIRNIGFADIDATHTTAKARKGESTKIEQGLDEFVEPSLILRHSGADHYTFEHHYGGKDMRFPFIFTSLINRCLNKAYRHCRRTIQRS